ncbi:MAG: hypothetical protein AAF496_17400, partial [Pseudomonadota bacterium]
RPRTRPSMAPRRCTPIGGSVVKIGKEAFYRQLQMPLDEAYAYTGDVMVENMLWQETEEGISAFIEKRDPDWHQ